ncbi:uncharacterized protein [Physcomitrium patens]|uniref:Uncharacterized protein n=1 Tax=Physcomitrium patens TaxID=3218 RepID=A0A2K1K6I1_PHYPA|nr:uncharacterized protein LOC112285317 [Physcomitrium patens]PNR49386.1 hypothetical protein PHYPA_011282 [Physcomitrium patens]|eukprot:XP_024381786.1 uncharacterized protein LOC112285317 [Physcomitrella patens]
MTQLVCWTSSSLDPRKQLNCANSAVANSAAYLSEAFQLQVCETAQQHCSACTGSAVSDSQIRMMWGEQYPQPAVGHMLYGVRVTKSAPCSPVKPPSKRLSARADSFHVVHKVPVGDTPYVKAKHVQLVDKDPDRAIALFWAAINAGDRVDSALKDMAIVMKQQNRPQEAIEAIKSLRSRCSDQAQESLDNVLLDLYKRCGRLDDQIDLLKHKLHLIHQGMAFNGKRTKTARSQGKKFQVSIEQEATRLLGNLGWACMQQSNFVAAEAVYRKALSIEPDNNKVCNLGICLMKQGRLEEAKAMLQSVTRCNDNRWASDSHLKSYDRAQEMLQELEASMGAEGHEKAVEELRSFAIPGFEGGYDLQHSSFWQPQPAMPRQPRRMARSNLEQQFSQSVEPSMSGALLATAGFGPSQQKSGYQAPATPRVRAHAASQQGDETWFQSGVRAGWSDEELNHPSLEVDDALNVQGEQSVQGYPGSAKQPMKWHAETLRQRLETVSVLGNAFMSRQFGMKVDVDSGLGTPPLAEQSLSSDAKPLNPAVAKEASVLRPIAGGGNGVSAVRPPLSSSERAPLTFDLTNSVRNGANVNAGGCGQGENRVKRFGVSGGWGGKGSQKTNPPGFGNGWASCGECSENQPAALRSLSMEITEASFSEKAAPAVIQPLQNQNVNINLPGLPPLHNAVGKRSRTLTPVKEKTVSAWSCLGFTQSPNDLDFGCENAEGESYGRDPLSRSLFSKELVPIPMADLSASEMEMKRQRRLKVFREMTLAASPQA